MPSFQQGLLALLGIACECGLRRRFCGLGVGCSDLGVEHTQVETSQFLPAFDPVADIDEKTINAPAALETQRTFAPG